MNNGRYRVVDEMLIINEDGWVINATFRLVGDSVYVDTGCRTVVMSDC